VRKGGSAELGKEHRRSVMLPRADSGVRLIFDEDVFLAYI